jgi:CubicO group peptidase (beta-lactamase class C family)
MLAGPVFLSLSLPRADLIDSYVEAQMAQQHIPGLCLLVVKDGKVIKEKAYGISNIETNRATQLTDRFDMGSIGKTFTATIIMQMVNEKKLSLDQKVKEILPDFPDKWRTTTIRHLMSHQSGIPDYALMTGIGLMDTYDQKKWIDTVYRADLDFPTGRLYQYSNSNFTILGLIIEKISAKTYREVVQTRIFDPARLTNTGFKDAGKGLPVGITSGYFFIDGKLQDAGPGGTSPTPSDGGEFTTVYDLQKWSNALKNGKVLPGGTVQKMQTPSVTASGRKTGYGLGWMTATVEGSPQITHGGNSVGFSGTLSTFPKQKLEVYMLCNLYPVGGDGFALGIARLLEPALMRKPQISTPRDPQPELTKKLKEGLLGLAKANIKSPIYHEDMQLRLATGRGQMALPAYANFTTVGKMEFISKRDEKPDMVYRYRVFDAKTSWIADFQVTKEGQIYSISKSSDNDKK